MIPVTFCNRQLPYLYPATEWLGPKEGERNVLLKLDEQKNHIVVLNERRKIYRTIDLNVPIRREFEVELLLGADRYMRTMAVRVRNEYDLVCRQCHLD